MVVQQIDYSRGIKKVTNIVHSDLRLKNEACALINQIINSLNRQILTCVPRGELGLEPLQRAVEELFLGDSRRHAVVEGNRIVLNYQSGLVDFRPAVVQRQQARERETRRRARRQRGAELKPGLDLLARQNCEGATVQRPAVQRLCQLLEDLMRCIARTARESAEEGQGCLTPEDVVEGARRWLQGNLCSHALAEGSKLLVMMDIGRVVFDPLRRRRRASVSASRDRKRAPAKRKSPAAKRPRRRRTPRKRKAEAGAEVSEEPDAPAAKRPRRRRTPRKRKAEAGAGVSEEPDAPAAKRPRSRATPRKKKATEKPKSKRAPRTTVKVLESGISKICKAKKANLDKSAKERAAGYVERVLARMLDELARDCSGQVQAQEVREAVLRVFPEEFRDTALANLSRVAALMQTDCAE